MSEPATDQGVATHIRPLALTMAVVFTPLALAKTTAAGWAKRPLFCIIYTCARRAFGHEGFTGLVSLRAALLVLNPDETAEFISCLSRREGCNFHAFPTNEFCGCVAN